MQNVKTLKLQIFTQAFSAFRNCETPFCVNDGNSPIKNIYKWMFYNPHNIIYEIIPTIFFDYKMNRPKQISVYIMRMKFKFYEMILLAQNGFSHVSIFTIWIKLNLSNFKHNEIWRNISATLCNSRDSIRIKIWKGYKALEMSWTKKKKCIA